MLTEYDLFISYQWGIQEPIKKLYALLLSQNYKVWMDLYKMDPSGPGLNEDLAIAIKKSKAVICCVTKAYEASKNCKQEINWANELDKPLIVLMCEKIQPRDINAVGFIISTRLRINLYDDEQAMQSWQGPKVQELLSAIDNVMKRSIAQENITAPEDTMRQEAATVLQRVNSIDRNSQIDENNNDIAQQNANGPKKSSIFAAVGDEIKVYDLATFECANVLKGHRENVKCLELVGEGKFLASAGDDNAIKLWDLTSFECVETFTGHSDTVWGLKSVAGSVFASCSWDKSVKVWDLAQRTCLASLEGHTGWVFCLEALNEGFLVSGGYDETIKVWDLESYQCVWTTKEHSYIVSCLKFFSERNLLASASREETIKLWDLESFSPILTLRGHCGGIYCLKRLSGDLLASGSDDRTIKIWDLGSGECLRTLDGSNGLVRAIEMVGERRFVSCSNGEDFRVKIWNLDGFECELTIETPKAVWCLISS